MEKGRYVHTKEWREKAGREVKEKAMKRRRGRGRMEGHARRRERERERQCEKINKVPCARK